MTTNDQMPAPFDPDRPLDADQPFDLPAAGAPIRARGRRGRIKAAAIGTIVAGGLAAAAIVGPLAADAASPSPVATNAPTATGGTVTGTDPAPLGKGGPGHDGGPGGFGHQEAVSDTSVIAKAIGIAEADLTTALQSGQTVAAVAKAHNVDAQTVIDALTADGLDELAAQVKAGTLTQAQADSMKTQVTQRATDQVNGTFGRH